MAMPESDQLRPEEDYLTEDEARSLYLGRDAAHDFDHVRRVAYLARHLARAEGADVTVVWLAALLHDVPVVEGAGGAPVARSAHHVAAATHARYLLGARGLGTERLDNIVHSIEAHRFRDQSIQPQTLEARCLYDADKLDSLGAIGVGRAFAYAGRHGSRLWTGPWSEVVEQGIPPTDDDYTPVHEYVYKLRRLLTTLYTDTARAIGVQRHAFMRAYFDQLDAEMQDLLFWESE